MKTYLCHLRGINVSGNTKLSNTFFEKNLKVQATTRNWKTILELVQICEANTLE